VDNSLGKPASVTDWNTGITRYTYSDPLDRLTLVTRPDNGSTAYLYPNLTTVTTTTVVTAGTDAHNCATSVSRVADSYYDGLGRSSSSVSHDPAGLPGAVTTP
jgi:YD repeat-containing protein